MLRKSLFALRTMYQNKKKKSLLTLTELSSALAKKGIKENLFKIENLETLKSSAALYYVEGHKYVLKAGEGAKRNVLNTIRSMDAANQKWLLRCDNTHPGANYIHLNLRHMYAGINDQHVNLVLFGILTAAKCSGYMGQYILVVDAYRLASAGYKDMRSGTIDHTVACMTDIVFTWAGGKVGADIGAGVVTILMPGVETLYGSLIGTLSGFYLGSQLATKLTNKWKTQKFYYNLSNGCARPYYKYSKFKLYSGLSRINLPRKSSNLTSQTTEKTTSSEFDLKFDNDNLSEVENETNTNWSDAPLILIIIE